MTVDISELANSASTDSSSDSETNSDSASSMDELHDVCGAIDANIDAAEAYVDEHGNKSDLIEQAKMLANDEELWALAEEYRRQVDLKRIIQGYLYNLDASFSAYLDTFWGDYDDPEEGTFNDVQKRFRDADLNLPMYKALFPEPAEQHWAREPVAWEKFGELGPGDNEKDSHIYVTQDYVEEFGDFTLDNGKPRPPSDSELSELDGDSSSDSSETATDATGTVFDPSKFNNDRVALKLEENSYTLDQLEALLEAEQDGKNRKGATGSIRDAIEAAEEAGGASGDSSESSDAKTPVEIAGEIVRNHNPDVEGSTIVARLETGLTREQVVEQLD